MNIYKPRYKIAFQAKSKIWPYKDSRLRRFFNIRGKKLVRRGFFKRYVIVFNNMKWTIARRYIRPYMRRRKAVRRRFRNAFYTKQQLRAFHGKIKEEKFRNFFRKYLTHGVNRNMSFYAALERRLDIFFFRMRLLPTIFACHQYILHHGVIVNKSVEHCPSALVRPGDILTVSPMHWKAFYYYLEERIMYRVHGKHRMLKRKYRKLKKKTWWIRNVLRVTKLIFSMTRKRNILDVYLLEWRTKFFSLITNLYDKILTITEFDKVIGTKAEKALSPIWLKLFFRLNTIYLNFKKFIHFEIRQRKAFFKLKRERLQGLKQILLFAKKHKYRRNKKAVLWLRTSPMLNQNLINMLKGITSTYLKWLSLLLQLRLEELKIYHFLFISLKGKETDLITQMKLKKILKERKKFLILQASYIRKNIVTYYRLYFHKFFITERRKSFFKDVDVYLRKTNQIIKKRVPTSNILTYFLIRRRSRIRRSKRTPRLKQIHWAIPRYIHFDLVTLRAVFLYSPSANEIHYSFKCSLPKIVSFYKSLGL